MHECVRLRVLHVSTRTTLCASMCAECVDTHDARNSIYTYTCIHIHECMRLRVLHVSTRTHLQTGCGTQGVIHMKDPTPLVSQCVVAGVAAAVGVIMRWTSKSGSITYKAIHAILSFIVTQVLQFF